MKSTITYIPILLVLSLCCLTMRAESEAHLRTVAFDKDVPIKIRQQAAKQLVDKAPKNAKYLLLLGELSMQKSDYGTALKTFDSLYINNYSELNKAEKCQLLADYGQVLSFFNGRKAVRISKELLEIEKTDTLKRYDFNAFLVLYTVGGRAKKTIYETRSYEKLQAIYDALVKENLLTDSWKKKFVGSLHKIKMYRFLDDQEVDSVIAESKNVLACAVSALDSTSAIVTAADAYKTMGRLDIAEARYLQVINDIAFNHNTPVAIINYLDMLIDMERFNDALTICQLHGEKVIDSGIEQWITYYHFCKGWALTETGNQKEGIEYLKKGFLGMNQLYQNSSSSYESLTEFEIDEILNDNIADKNKARQRGWLNIVLISIMCATICLSLFLWRKLRKSDAHIKQLNDKYKNDFQRFDAQHRELTSLSLQLAKLQSMVDDAKKSLADNGNSSEPAYGILREANAAADSWNSFKLYFEGCHPNFLKNLYARHPQLSEYDVRTCVYILMNFTSKEIASLSNRAVRTIESQKYRLNKKLNLKPNTSILEYLRGLT